MYSAISTHTHYSLLRGFSKPAELADVAQQLGIQSIALTDFDTVSGAVDFVQSCAKKKIKAILGTKLFISDHDGYVTCLAQNEDGWRELIALSTESHQNKPIGVPFEKLKQTKNLIVLSGEPDTTLCRAILDKKIAYLSQTPHLYEDYFLRADHENAVWNLLDDYVNAFGDRFYMSLYRYDGVNAGIDNIIADKLRAIADKRGIKCCAANYSFYTNKADAADHRLLICSHNKIVWTELNDFTQNEQHAGLARFVHSDNYYLLSDIEMRKIYKVDEVENTNLISDACEPYSILSEPSLPKFDCPTAMTEADYLRQLCREGWKKMLPKFNKSRLKEYTERIKMELDVFHEANLEGYFLIVQDYVNWARKQGVLVGCSRGSAGGCLVSYLIGITSIDPVEYDLYFERFYNKGRNSDGKVSLPDIDVDFPVMFREKVIEYIRQKYGAEQVSQVATFSRLQGRGAIREVMRIHQASAPDIINMISKRIPQEAEIADKLEESKETSILRWTLHNMPEDIKEWCYYRDDGQLDGPMAQYFEQAIRIEGTYKSYGKHASAIVVGKTPISTVCPMLRDKKSGAPLASIEYEKLEAMGLPKFDILGTTILDKLMGVNQLLLTGRLENDADLSEFQESDAEE